MGVCAARSKVLARWLLAGVSSDRISCKQELCVETEVRPRGHASKRRRRTSEIAMAGRVETIRASTSLSVLLVKLPSCSPYFSVISWFMKSFPRTHFLHPSTNRFQATGWWRTSHTPRSARQLTCRSWAFGVLPCSDLCSTRQEARSICLAISLVLKPQPRFIGLSNRADEPCAWCCAVQL